MVLIITAILTFALALGHVASAKEVFKFNPHINTSAFDFRNGYWQIKEDNPSYAPYKQEVLRQWQDALRSRGINNKDDLKVFTAQIMQEDGSLSPLTIGDHGCSLGLPQRNFCAATNRKFNATTAMKKWPEWNDLGFQLNWFADRVKDNMTNYKSVKWSVISHNRPLSARNKEETVYWTDVNNRKSMLVWKI